MKQSKTFATWYAVAAMCMSWAPGSAPADEVLDGVPHLRNNLVTELLDVASVQKKAAYTFQNPRDGWVFISMIPGAGETTVSLAPAPKAEARVLRGVENGTALEIMRLLSAGAYRLHVRGEDSSRLVVRAIPELIYTGLGYGCGTRADKSSPWLESFGPYDWRFLEDNKLLENFNVILERGDPRPQNVRPLEAWRAQGKKVLTASFVDWLKTRLESITADAVFTEWSKYGFETDGIYGTLMSEFGDGSWQANDYPAMIEVVKRLSKEPKFKDKVFYPFTYHSMVQGEHTTTFLKTVLDADYRYADERYLEERPTETEALDYIDAALRQHLLSYQKVFPDCARQLIMNLGLMSIPHLTQDVNPAVDYKVFLDMQMNLIANDPAFRGIYGVSWYHSAYADEEVMRWSAKLNRHYCIEGRTDRLTTDPYELPHLKNPDFDDGLDGWTLDPAEEGSIVAGEAEHYGMLQGRFKSKGEGNRFLVTRRSANAPNRVSQSVVNLTPGRLYSLRMYVCDRRDLAEGRSVRKSHDVTMAIDGGELLPGRSFREVVFNERAYAGFSSEHPLYMTYQRIVFRAAGATARLVISDWDTRPVGPIGQELAINYVQLQPYLEVDAPAAR
jgi:hypothetical protein